jgi:hypothetical protein
MYFIATLHPLIDPNSQDAKDGYLSVSDKRDIIRDFYTPGAEEIPLCVNHGEGDVVGAGYKVAIEDRIGKVLDLFNNKEGEMVVKCVLSPESKHYQSVNQSIFTDNAKWGVSVWVDITDFKDDVTPVKKNLTHVALTNEPYFGEYNTFIHHWSLNETAIDRVISEEYIKGEENEGHSFITVEFRQKLLDSSKKPRLFPIEEKLIPKRKKTKEIKEKEFKHPFFSYVKGSLSFFVSYHPVFTLID